MDNLTRFLSYVARSALARAKDPDGFNARFAAGLRLQTRDFKWLHPAAACTASLPSDVQAVSGTSNVLPIRKRRA